MKTITRILTIAATAALFGGTAALADDPALQNRLAMQKQQAERNQAGVTVGFYNRGKGIGHTAKTPGRTDLRVKEHFMPHGTAHYLLVPAK